MIKTEWHNYLIRLPRRLFQEIRKEAFRREIPISKVVVERLESKRVNENDKADKEC
jgi:hypothetical protein